MTLPRQQEMTSQTRTISGCIRCMISKKMVLSRNRYKNDFCLEIQSMLVISTSCYLDSPNVSTIRNLDFQLSPLSVISTICILLYSTISNFFFAQFSDLTLYDLFGYLELSFISLVPWEFEITSIDCISF